MALILTQPNSDLVILKRSFAARLSSFIWFGWAGFIMVMFEQSNLIWLALPCLLMGIHLLTYTVRIRLWGSGRDIRWKRRTLLLFASEYMLPFAGVRSVRIGMRGTFFQRWRIYFLLVDGSRLSVTRSYLPDRIRAQADVLARFVGKPLVYEQQDKVETKAEEE